MVCWNMCADLFSGGATVQWIEVDAAKILEQEFEGHHYRQQHHVPTSREHVESAQATYPYPQRPPQSTSHSHRQQHQHQHCPPQPQQLQADQSWRPAQTTIQQSLHALSDAPSANDHEEERTLHPYDFSFFADENDDDDEDDLDYVPISPSDLLPLSKNQQEQMQLRRQQEEQLEELGGIGSLAQQQEQEQLGMQTGMDVDVDVETTQAREYAEESLDLFLKNAAAHAAAGYIDPSLGRLTDELLGDGEEQDDMRVLWGSQGVIEEEHGRQNNG